MGINTTVEAQDRQAAEDLADKLRLEAKVKPQLKRFFKTLADDLEASVLITGGVQTTTRYSKALEGLLTEHYERVKRVFSNNWIDKLEDEPESSPIWIALLLIGRRVNGFNPLNTKDDILKMLKADTIIRTNEFIELSVTQDTGNISTTNDKDLQAAVSVAGIKLVEELEREPTRAELAKASRTQFLKHDFSRNETIAATTTQKAAEGMKHINREVYLNFRNGVGPLTLGLPVAQVEEIWKSRGDSVVRPAHLQADGQVKKNGVFIVKGQSLRYPGDTSLGATLDNTINCRCSNVFSLDEDDSITENLLG